MMKIRSLAHAAILAAGFVATPIFVAACPVDQGKPITAGPLMTQALNTDPATGQWPGPFSEWIVDMNGVGLQICTDSADGTGTPPPCFYDPVDPATPYSASLSRGGESFWYLADNTFGPTTGANPINAVIVMGVESAFLSDPPQAGFETQFQRLRTRVNVSAIGKYTVETPWSKKTYTVDALLPGGNGQNRMEISDPIDISFNPNSSAPGMVAPFVLPVGTVIDPLAVGYTGYIGDGLTPGPVTGSPCGSNFIQVTAVTANGAPIDIGGNVRNAQGVLQTNVYRNTSFTVMGKLAPTSAVPLSIGAAYYTRNGGHDQVTVMAEGSTSASQFATTTLELNGQIIPLDKELNRFYTTKSTNVPVTVTPTNPQMVTVRAEDPGRPSKAHTEQLAIKDLVTISSAVASCTGTGATKCTLKVSASSSDDGSLNGGVPPALTLQHLPGTPWVNGTATVSSAAVPATVTVKSANGGVAVKPVTITN
jgi:hypothetical protein